MIVLKKICILLVFSLLGNACNASHILILGGNGMMGSATVRSLLAEDNSHDITIVNRGNWYWDAETLIKPHVTHLTCTRGDGFRESCLELGGSKVYDVLIDFSTYEALDMEDILIVLGGRFKRYIYISSDSVYEVCKSKTHAGYSKEEDAIRPEDETSRLEYMAKDRYGHNKLEGEEVLKRYHKELNYEYVSLRLPDVIGPRDNTVRFYKYFLWVKLHEVIGPVHIPQHIQDKQLSFVYSLDVASLIASLVNPVLDTSVFNTSYNLAFEETITLKDLLLHISSWIEQEKTFFDETAAAHVSYGLPSVTRGPVDITKAVMMLKWSPTKLHTALNACCEFYEKAQYDGQFRHILHRVLNTLDVRGEKYRDFVNIHLSKRKVEL